MVGCLVIVCGDQSLDRFDCLFRIVISGGEGVFQVVGSLAGLIDSQRGQGHLQVHRVKGQVGLGDSCQHVFDRVLGVMNVTGTEGRERYVHLVSMRSFR